MGNTPETPPGSTPGATSPMPSPNATPPAPTPPTPPTSTPASTEPPTTPTQTEKRLEFSEAAFQERMDRERRKANESFIEELGFKSREEFETWKKEQDEAAAARAEEERANMSELERLKSDMAERDQKLAEEKAAREAAEQQAEAARVEAHLHGVFAEKGIKNPDYAFFKIEQKLNTMKDEDEPLDENAFLDELISDPRESIALGVTDPPGVEPLEKKATTTPSKTGPEPKAPGAPPNKHVSDMSPDEWKAYQKQRGLVH